ncbi:MAG: PspC domain-containing protein [Prevotellaceae bacterium]|jgi:phage shock protein C|nr:PspC domain-containing protein [Prevotellaceae bacterium]
MKRVISIHLDGRIFQIEEDGYDVLVGVLSHQPYKNEAEKQFADKLEQKLVGNKTVITYLDVVEASYNLGFTITDARRVKRLYRQPKGKILAGICTGLGEYFDIDPVIFRVLFVISFIMAGMGFWIYLVIWIITPKYEDVKLL